MATEGTTPNEEAVKEAVLEILQEADLEKTTEFKVRELASQKLGADLNQPAHKKLIRKVVGDYLNERAEEEAKPATPAHSADDEEANAPPAPAPSNDVDSAHHDEGKFSKAQDESDDGDDAQPSRFARRLAPPPKQRKQTVGDDDDNLICQLSNKRNVSIQKFRGKTLVSIREYYEKDGELRPSAKGISLSVDQWQVFKNNVSAIESAIAELQ